MRFFTPLRSVQNDTVEHCQPSSTTRSDSNTMICIVRGIKGRVV